MEKSKNICMEEKGVMGRKPVLLKQASPKQGLKNWENILITKNKDRMKHFEIPPVVHLTRKFVLNPGEGSTSAPKRLLNSQQSIMG
jgi:hypothetical protein